MRLGYWVGLTVFEVSLITYGQWQPIDDFQQWAVDDIFYEATEIGWSACSQWQIDEYWMLADPYDPDNIGVYVGSSNHDYLNATTLAMKALPGSGIDPGGAGTLFFRCLFVGPDMKWNMATTDKPLAFDAETGLQTAPGAFSDLNALIRFEGEGLEHWDGDGYVTTNPPVVPSYMVWYKFWMVVENTWDMTTTPPTSTGVHTLYVEGKGNGAGINPTLIPVGSNPPKDSASFLRAPVDDEGNPQAIIWAVFATDSGLPGRDLFLLDDLYFSKGENLTDPISYGGHTVDGSRDTDTGDFLGWLNVAQAPYIWSYFLKDWLYMEEPAASAAGAWVYFFK